MQFKLATIAITMAVSSLAVANPIRRTDGNSPSDQCNTGTLQCCNSAQSASSPSIAGLLGLLGVAVQSVDALVGVTCSPITAIGLGGSSCSAQPVCCTNNSFNGVIALGCTPININA